jgi:hypothetical protein
VTTLIAAWTANSLWSFTSLPTLLNMQDGLNPYVTLAVTLVVIIVGNLIVKGKPGFFSSAEYQARLKDQSTNASA